LSLIGQYEKARNAYEDARSRVPEGDRIWRSRLHRHEGHTWYAERRRERPLQAYDMAEAALGPEPTEPTEAWQREWLEIQLDRVRGLYLRGRADEIARLAEKMRPVVEQHGTPAQRTQFFHSLWHMALLRDRYVVSQSTLAYAEATHEPFPVAFSHLCRGELDAAEAGLQATLEWHGQTGNVAGQVTSLTYLAIVYRKRGQEDQVRQYTSRSLEAAAGKMPIYIGMAKANLAWLAWREGNWADVQTNGRAGPEIWSQTMRYPFEWAALWPLIAVALIQGQDAEAVEHTRALLSPSQMRLPEPLEVVLRNAIAAWDAGDVNAACARLNEAVELAQQTGWL
jgi:tetratricopeptide (TPR) repeat protein